MIVNLQFCLLVLIISGLSSVFAAEWSEWTDITHCSSKPCKCYPADLTPCDSNGRKAQIRQCIRGKGEIDTCKGGGPFRLYTGCNNKNRCPGWSDWSVWSECDCTLDQMKRERLCNNPAPIHPEVLCSKFDSTGGTIEEEQQACKCSGNVADEIAETTTTPTTKLTNTTGNLEWCCDMYKENEGDNTNANNIDSLDEYPNDEARSARSADNYYHYYDGVCTPCTVENGYKGKDGKDDKNDGNDVLGR